MYFAMFLTLSLTDNQSSYFHLSPLILTSIHKINLVVGDYFKSQTSVLEFSDQATELITWLHSKTQVLALLREVQELQAILGSFVIKAIICAILT